VNIVSINANELEWQPALTYPGKAEEKVLSGGGSIVPRTILLRIPSGWSMGRHSHRHTEVHYVLDGEYQSDNQTYGKGTFRMIPATVEHGPFGTENGATILVIWCRTPDEN
jgi:anti-sigma factor ChrR (cupin superfamily)